MSIETLAKVAANPAEWVLIETEDGNRALARVDEGLGRLLAALVREGPMWTKITSCKEMKMV